MKNNNKTLEDSIKKLRKELKLQSKANEKGWKGIWSEDKRAKYESI